MVSSNSQYTRGVGTFTSRSDADKALNELKNTGFSMDRVSILAQNKDSNQIAGAEVKDRGDDESTEGAGIGAVTGSVLGGIGGLLVGLEALIIPGVGPFLAAGTIATTLAGAGIGAASGALVGSLTGAGIPEEDAQAYSERISKGDYLVIIEGQNDEIERVGSIFKRHNISNWKTYPISNAPNSNRYDAPLENRDTQKYTDRTDIEHDVVEIVDKRDSNRFS